MKAIETRMEPCTECGIQTEIVYLFNQAKNHLCANCLDSKRSSARDKLDRDARRLRMDIVQALKRIQVRFNGDVELASHNPRIAAVQTELRNLCKTYESGFYLHGPPGSGKTTNMQLFAHSLIYTPHNGQYRPYDAFLFLTEAQLISKVFSLAKDELNWDFQRALHAVLDNRRYIFIDELAAKRLHDQELQIVDLLFHYLEERTGSVTVFITSNKGLERLAGHYESASDRDAAERIISRLHSLTFPYELSDPDYRKTSK